jgi:hypothetical protein
MNYIIESLFIGIYSAVIYLICNIYISNFYILLGGVGFCKHLLGNILGIHNYYCNNGYACLLLRNNKIGDYYITNNSYLFLESILESIAYILLGTSLHMVYPSMPIIYNVFMIGVILHIVSEHLHIHNYFCINRCYKSNTNE